MGEIDKSKSLKREHPKVQRLAKIDFERLKISMRRIRYSLRAGSHLEPTRKLYIYIAIIVHGAFFLTSVEIYSVKQSR